MKKTYRIIAAITLSSFFLTTILSDIAIGQPLNRQINSDKLATPSNLDDIVMPDAQIMNNIAFALYDHLALLNYQEKDINPETLKALLRQQKIREDERFEYDDDMEFYFDELEAVSLSWFVVKCRVKITNGATTYYALFSPFRDDDNGFPIKVYTAEKIKELYPGLGQLAARESASGDKMLVREYASAFANLCEAYSKTAPDSVKLAERIFGAYKAECFGWLNDANIEMMRKELIGLINNVPPDKVGAVIAKALSILEEAGIGDEEVSITSGLRAILKTKLEGRDAGDVHLVRGAYSQDSLLTKYERLFKSLCDKTRYSEKAVSIAEIIFEAYLTKLRGNVDKTTRQSLIDRLKNASQGVSKEDIEESFELLAEAAINHSDIHDFDENSLMVRLCRILNAKRPKRDIMDGFGLFGPRSGGRDDSHYSALPQARDEAPDETRDSAPRQARDGIRGPARDSASGSALREPVRITTEFAPFDKIIGRGRFISVKNPKTYEVTLFDLNTGEEFAWPPEWLKEKKKKEEEKKKEGEKEEVAWKYGDPKLRTYPEINFTGTHIVIPRWEPIDKNYPNHGSRCEITVCDLRLNAPVEGLMGLDATYGYIPLSTRIVVCGFDAKLTVYDLKTGLAVPRLKGLAASGGYQVVGKHLAVRDKNGRLTVYDFVTGEVIRNLRGLDASKDFQLSSEYIAYRDSNNELRVYHLETGILVIGPLRGISGYSGYKLSDRYHYLVVRDRRGNLDVYDLKRRSFLDGFDRLTGVENFDIVGAHLAVLFTRGRLLSVYNLETAEFDKELGQNVIRPLEFDEEPDQKAAGSIEMKKPVTVSAYNGYKLSTTHVMAVDQKAHTTVRHLMTGGVVSYLKNLPELEGLSVPVTITGNPDGKVTIMAYPGGTQPGSATSGIGGPPTHSLFAALLAEKRGEELLTASRTSASGREGQADKRDGRYQVVTSKELGVSVLMGAVSNTLKDMMAGRAGLKPDGNYVITLPPKLFDGRRDYGELEFLLYFNAFVRGNLFKPNGRGLRVVGAQKQLEALTKYLELALFGPNLDNAEFSRLSPEEKEFFKVMKEHYAVRSKDGRIIPIDRYIETTAFDKHGEAAIEERGEDGSVKGSLKISQLKPPGGEPTAYQVAQRIGEEEKALGNLQIRYDMPEPQVYNVPQGAHEALERGRYGFSRTWIGTSTGFDPKGDVTSQIIWLEGKGIWVDPSHEGLRYMRSLGLTPEDVPYILLTHTHQDHDGGVLERILIGKKIRLIASSAVCEMFLMKTRLLLGLTGSSTKPEELVEWIPLNPGKPLVMKLDSGRKAVLRSWWNLHPIPTNGFSVTYDGFRYAHSGDTQWDPRDKGFIDELQGKGRLTPSQASRQKRRFTTRKGRSKYDYIDFEGGGGMIHTKLETLAAFPEAVRDRISVYHTADAEAEKYPGLRKARMFETDVFIPSDDERKERYMLGVLAGNALLKGKSGDFYEVFNRLARTEHVAPGEKLTIEGYRVRAVSYNGVQELFGEGPGAEGDEGRVYFIEGGKAGVWVGSKKVAELGPGQHFGDWSIVTGEPRSATVIAEEPLTVRSLTPAAYLALFGDAATRERIRWIRDNIDVLNRWTRKTTSRVFQDLTDFAITVLAGKSKTLSHKVGSVIITEGEAPNGEFYIIKKGTVEVTKNGHPLAKLKPYDHFGEIAILRNVERTATVTAKTDVELLVLERGLVRELLDHYPSIRAKVDEEMAHRIKKQIEDFINRPSRRAFASNLNVVELRILLAQLANRYGTDRVSLLFDMIDKKIVDLAGGLNGTLVRELRGMGFSNVFGVDIAIAKKEAKPWLLRGDITDLKGEIPDGTIDVAFITNFLQNEYEASDARLRDFYRPIAGEIYRILKPGGSLYLISGDEAYPALGHFRDAGLEVTTLLAGMYEITRPAAEIVRQSASGKESQETKRWTIGAISNHLVVPYLIETISRQNYNATVNLYLNGPDGGKDGMKFSTTRPNLAISRVNDIIKEAGIELESSPAWRVQVKEVNSAARVYDIYCDFTPVGTKEVTESVSLGIDTPTYFLSRYIRPLLSGDMNSIDITTAINNISRTYHDMTTDMAAAIVVAAIIVKNHMLPAAAIGPIIQYLNDSDMRDHQQTGAVDFLERRSPGISSTEANKVLNEAYDMYRGLFEDRVPISTREERPRQSASGEAEPVSRNYSVEVAALIGQGQPRAAADIVGGLYRQWKELRQEDIESEALRLAEMSLREACLAIIKAQPLQRKQILKSERLGSEARRLLFVLGVSLSLSQKDRTGVLRKLLEFLFPLVNPLKIKEAVTLNEAIYLLKEEGAVWEDENNEWRIASIEGNYYLGVEELKAMRASLEFGGNLSERPTLANPEAQKIQPPVILLAVSEAIAGKTLATAAQRFQTVCDVLGQVSEELLGNLREVTSGFEGPVPSLENPEIIKRINALPVSRQEKEALFLAFERESKTSQSAGRPSAPRQARDGIRGPARDSASGAEDERAREEIAYMREELAPKVGVNVALPVQSYTVFASYDFLTDEEYRGDRDSYLYRFGLKRILTDKPEEMVDWVIGAVESKKLDPKDVLNPEDVIVQLPKDFSDDKYRPELEKLEARGIKFMILNTNGLEKESKEARAEYRRNIYVMMLLARNINKDTLPESSLYRLLRFFIASHLEDFEGKEAAIDNYIDDIKNNNIAGLIKVMLSYKPVAPYDSEALREEYNGVAKALVSA